MASFRLGGEAGGQTTTRDSTTGAGPDCSRYGGGDSGGATAELSQPSRELPGVAVSETPSSLNVILSVYELRIPTKYLIISLVVFRENNNKKNKAGQSELDIFCS